MTDGQPIGGGGANSGYRTPENNNTQSPLSSQQKMVREEWGLPATHTGPTPLKAPPTATNSASYGLHPEEGPGKPKDGEDMLLDYMIE